MSLLEWKCAPDDGAIEVVVGATETATAADEWETVAAAGGWVIAGAAGRLARDHNWRFLLQAPAGSCWRNQNSSEAAAGWHQRSHLDRLYLARRI